MATKKTAKKKPAPRATASKPPPKKAAPKKAAPKKAAPRKAAPRKAAPRKAAPRKVAPKKATPTMAAPSKATPATTSKTEPRKAAPSAAATTQRAAKSSARAEAQTPKKPVLRDPSLDVAQAVAALALEKKADDMVILRVTDLTSYADGFVLASAPSERQVQAIARFVDDEMRKAGKAPVGTEGMDQGQWVLVDFGAVVLHVFLATARQYYDLEGFWSEAPRVDIDEAYGKGVLDAMRTARDTARAEAASA